MSVSKATVKDLRELARIASHVVSTVMALPKDEERVYSILKQYVSSPGAAVLVSKQDGKIRGGAVAITTPNPYCKKFNTQILGLFTDVPRDGIQMVEQIVEHFYSRPNSIMLCYAAPVETKLDTLLQQKFNLKRQGTMLVRRK